MNAAFMWISGAPRRLDTSTSTPWLVGTEQPGTSSPERYWSRRPSLWLKPPVQNTTPRRARMRRSSAAVTPTTSPASLVSTPSTGWLVRMSDATLTGRGLHAAGELDPVARLPVGQLRDDDTAEGHLVDLVVAVVVGVVVGVHHRQGADVDQRLHRGRAVVDERLEQLVLPGRKAARRVLRVVHRRPREPRQVGHRVLARVGDALLLHEVVVGIQAHAASLAPGPADLVGGLEQDGRRAELRGVHRRAEPGDGRPHHDDVGFSPTCVAVDGPPDLAHRCSPLTDDRRRR